MGQQRAAKFVTWASRAWGSTGELQHWRGPQRSQTPNQAQKSAELSTSELFVGLNEEDASMSGQ
jgi:hypothetical protein